MADLTPEQQAAIDAAKATNAKIDAEKAAALDAIGGEYDAGVARMESNKANALANAAKRAAMGDTAGEARWLASAGRYDTLIGIKSGLKESKLKLTGAQFDRNKVGVPVFEPIIITKKPIITKEDYGSVSDYRAPSPTPPAPVSAPPPPPPVKTAPLDTILYEEDPIPVEIMADIIFENIGGQELINIARNDIVNGQKVIYQPIKNLNSIQQEYNPNNILALQDASPQIFGNYPIKLEEKIPNIGNGPDGSNVYISSSGELVIEVINMAKDEQVEVEITQGGTIYEVQL